jgi:hypothetical protein
LGQPDHPQAGCFACQLCNNYCHHNTPQHILLLGAVVAVDFQLVAVAAQAVC